MCLYFLLLIITFGLMVSVLLDIDYELFSTGVSW